MKMIVAADTGLEWQLYRLLIDDTYPKPDLSSANADVVVDRKGNIPYCLTAERATEAEYLPLRVATPQLAGLTE